MQTDFKYLDDDFEIVRPLTRENIMIADSARDWLNDSVSDLFIDYCQIFEIHVGYGVQSFDIYGPTISIEQDTSCMDCSDSKRHVLQAEWLWSDNRLALIREYKNKLDGIKGQIEERKKQRRIASLEAELAKLKGNT